KARELWLGHAAGLERASAAIEARRLAEAARLGKELAADGLGDPDARALEEARASMEKGFDRLLVELDLGGPRGALARGADLLGELPAARYPRECLARLETLESRTAGAMTPIGGGEVKVRGGAPKKVESFFIDRFEVSVGSYRAFLPELKKLRFEEVR